MKECDLLAVEMVEDKMVVDHVQHAPCNEQEDQDQCHTCNHHLKKENRVKTYKLHEPYLDN